MNKINLKDFDNESVLQQFIFVIFLKNKRKNIAYLKIATGI